MRTAYFDCFSGIAGNMILGALLDLGLPLAELQAALSGLPVTGYRLSVTPVRKRGIAATHLDVAVEGEQPERHLSDVLAILDRSGLPEPVHALAGRVFRRLAAAEAAVHGVGVEQVHFHEVGAVDAIVDVVGAAFGLHRLGIESVVCSPVNVGSGFVRTAHGSLPVPAPATIELLRGAPVYQDETTRELATPTGAAIVAEAAARFGSLPRLVVERVGYGAGTAELDHPNVLRIVLGQVAPVAGGPDGLVADRVALLETNLDDMNPEFCEYVLERLLSAGALDVSYTPILMKKGRPGLMLTVIAEPSAADSLLRIVLAETTTLGVRVSEVERRCLPRESRTVATPYGEVRIKVGVLGNRIVNAAPEYEDVKRAAIASGAAIKDVYDAAKRAAGDLTP